MPPKPFRPNPIHRFYDWLDRLPIPMWVFYPLILLLFGLTFNFLAWSRGLLPRGQFNFILLLDFIWLVESLALLHFALRASVPLLDGYRNNLDVNNEEFQRLRYEFTIIPNVPGILFFLLGLTVGYFVGINSLPAQPRIAQAFAPWVVFQWSFSLGLAFLSIYFIIRQLRLFQKFFDLTKRISFSHLDPIYAFSRYTAVIGFGIFMISFVNSFLIAPGNFQNAYSSAVAYFPVIIVLAIFYLPLRGINQRLVAEKKRMLKNVNERMEKMFARIHRAEEKEDYKNALGLRNLLSALNDEKVWLESVSTWPWNPRTFTTLLSALLLPTVLSLVNSVISRLLGL